ncbi:uncharacterized protein LOC110416794 isoform X2 [Herrania umbratica]|uniref:Uncharacterized protein LOC110416794 isoform X2 n=1 Tax=Herrania umbratica TaxID=108875 RepID=A0A6J1AC54_9ROSI|nr:uncharacterized protein LOC110416794 isoform X2 [Herrania umbratica]
MDESAEKKEQELVMVSGTNQRERRSVRRRLVQSTLFLHKSPEIELKVDLKANEGKDDNNDGEDEEFCSSQGKRKIRKRKQNVTPQKRASRKAKGKSPLKTTPKKNGMSNLMESEDASPPPIPNLRLEAKLTAEENFRMFAGRQIHPFFASCKAGKRSQETAEVGSNGCLIDRSNKCINIGPIHVFDRTEDDVVLDWKDWTFFEKTSVEVGCTPEGLFTSVFKSCAGALCLDNFPGALHSSDTSVAQNKLSDQCIIHDNDLLGTSLAIPAVLLDEQLESYQLFKSSEGECQGDEIAALSKQTDDVENSELEQQTNLLQERFVPCYHGCIVRPDDSLWTDKYQPKKATEVCGNTESVKFMSEWLHLWHERSFQAIKAFNNNDEGNIQEDDDNGCESDFDSENMDGEHRLKNVLLVTGPTGSGKSAAIHACAKEHGFKVLESNASDCRNGAVVKQKFGEALESRCFTGSIENPVGSLNQEVMKSSAPLSDGEAAKEFDDEVIELIPMLDEDDSFGAHGASRQHVCKEIEAGFAQAKVKPLILFEDVDISFPEDHGFVAAIQKIAEKAKGPVILTSNSNNLVLPDKLNRLELCFTMPSTKELLHHLHMVCAAEKATIQPHLLEQLIKCCQGDIRKTIMHLQFWCQSKKNRKDGKLQKTYSLLLFDIEVGHLVLPTLIPWEFPSQLSELVETEIAKTLSMMEENSTLMEVMEEELEKNMPNRSEMHNNEIDSIEAKKEVMLSRNLSIEDCGSINPSYTAHEFYNSSGTPVSFSRRTRRRKLDVVMSSDSEDEHFNKQPSSVSDKNVNRELFIGDCGLLSHCPNMQKCISPLIDELLCSESEKHEDRGFQCSETAINLQSETCKSVDVSCVPESSFVSETEIVNGMELSSRTAFPETTEVSVSCEFTENLLPVETNGPGKSKSIHNLVKASDILDSACNIIAQASHEMVVENSENEYDEAVSRGHAVMDEYSRMDFNKRSFSREKFKNQLATDLVQKSWKKLRDNRADLNHYVDSEPKEALKILKLSSRISDLISQADQLLSKCQMLDFLDLLMIPSENSDAFSWCDEQLQMVNTVSQHGFCLYAKDIDAIGSKMGLELRVDLSQEILVSSTSTMALGSLLGQGGRASRTSVDGKGLDMSASKCELSMKRDVKSCLSNIVGSIVPSRSHFALNGAAFHEYISSLRCISRSEASRLSVGMNWTKRRRARGSWHYLSTGALMLSPEDISLLDQYNFYGKLSSKS